MRVGNGQASAVNSFGQMIRVDLAWNVNGKFFSVLNALKNGKCRKVHHNARGARGTRAPLALFIACLIARFFLMPLESEGNQAIQQLRIRQAARFPHLGIHTDRGEAWQCV